MTATQIDQTAIRNLIVAANDARTGADPSSWPAARTDLMNALGDTGHAIGVDLASEIDRIADVDPEDPTAELVEFRIACQAVVDSLLDRLSAASE